MVVLIGELMKQAERYISEGLHPRIIAEARAGVAPGLGLVPDAVGMGAAAAQRFHHKTCVPASTAKPPSCMHTIAATVSSHSSCGCAMAVCRATRSPSATCCSSWRASKRRPTRQTGGCRICAARGCWAGSRVRVCDRLVYVEHLHTVGPTTGNRRLNLRRLGRVLSACCQVSCPALASVPGVTCCHVVAPAAGRRCGAWHAPRCAPSCTKSWRTRWGAQFVKMRCFWQCDAQLQPVEPRQSSVICCG